MEELKVVPLLVLQHNNSLLMSLIKSEEEINLIRQSSLLVGKTLAEIAKYIKPGVSTSYLDEIAEEYILSNNAVPAFKGYHGFPSTLCISVNDGVVHGIPSNVLLKEGDIVSVDCGVLMNGYYGDSAYTFAVGDVDTKILDLLRITKESLYKGIEQAIVGNTVGDIGFAIQLHVEKHRYGIVKDLVGHGIGKELHEDPQVPNYGKKGKGFKLRENMVICIEPMINMGTHEVFCDVDKWTIKTKDKKPSAHFEHQIVIKNNKAEILSSFDFIEEVLNLQN